MRLFASLLLAVVTAGCGIPIRESYWQPEAAQGILKNYSTCDIGGARWLEVPLGDGARLSTHAESSEGEFVATFYLHGTLKAKPITSTVTLSSGDRVVDIPLLLTTTNERVDPVFKGRARLPQDEKVVVATLPDFDAGGGTTLSIPPITYRFGAHSVLKCIHF